MLNVVLDALLLAAAPSFRRDQIHAEIHGVHARGHRSSNYLLEVCHGVGHRPIVDRSAGFRGEEKQMVKHLGDLDAGLVDDHHDGGAQLVGDVSHVPDARLRVGGGEAACGLVTEKKPGSGGDATREGQPAALAAGDATDLAVADVGIADLVQPEHLQALLHEFARMCTREAPRPLGLEGSVEEHRLLHREVRWHDVVLRNVRGHPREKFVPRPTVEVHGTTVGRGLLIG
mmetsp:Transcript_12131/g.32527  ORF Transcript_12131/g.32527 Transcript_12131/m.32527 type:complete len:230 (+) Transcript_12131:1107-1796(+)